MAIIEPSENGWVTRLLDEREELMERLSKLQKFVKTDPKFQKLHATDRSLLCMQADAMNIYEKVLTQRIERSKRV